MWSRRLDETYASVRRGIERAENDPDHWPQVAKFAQAAGSLIDTGMRACGVLAGGVDNSVTVNVEQLVVLPTPTVVRSVPTVIDVDSKDDKS
jgi:hypothetical protein